MRDKKKGEIGRMIRGGVVRVRTGRKGGRGMRVNKVTG